MKKGFLACLAAVAVSATLLWAAFAPLNETADLAFALAPMLLLARTLAPKRAATWWFTFGLAFWIATLSWFPAIIPNNGPWPLVVLGWTSLAALCACYFALFGFLSSRLWQRVRALPPAARLAMILLGEPVLWAGLEWVRGWLFTGFAWNPLAVAVAHVPSLAAPAALGGTALVSGLTVLVNGVFATLGERALAPLLRTTNESAPRPPRLLRSLETALPLALVLLILWLSPRPSDPARTLRVALIQRNAPCLFSKGPREDPREVFGRLLETASPAKPDLLVFAESAFAEFGTVRGLNARTAAAAFLRQTGARALLAGGDDTMRTNGARHVYNAAALYVAPANGIASATNLAVSIYHKVHLVPFGEYIPFDKWVPLLQKLSPIGVSCWPGETITLDFTDANGEHVAIAPLICYEDTDSNLTRAAARQGAQALVLITNDSWFAHSHETEQHAAHAVLRALETGLPVLRTGNSGVTGVIGADGRTRWLSRDARGTPLTDAAGCQLDTVSIPITPTPTPFTRFGNLPLALLFGLTLLLATCWKRQER